jgi:site-specific recombinase XerD
MDSGYTEKGIEKHERTYRMIQEYAKERNESHYSEELGRSFVMDRYGAVFDSKRGNNSYAANEKIVHLEKLCHYQRFGTIYFARSGKKQPFSCPAQFQTAYSSFLRYCHEYGYSDESLRSIFFVTRKFLTFLKAQNVLAFDQMTAETMKGFQEAHAECSTSYLRTLMSKLKVFLRFLYDEGYVSEELVPLIPEIRHIRNAFLPSQLSQEDIAKILSCVDRNNPIGKRDYAMLMMVIRLGLRSTDIRTIQLTDLDWHKDIIRIVQSKTSQPLELPLSNDVGWAIIDYLRNGRPDTDESTIFVRHSPEGGPISNTNRLGAVLHKYMRKAGIPIPKDEARGLHSLRASLARAMLETGTPLPVISEVLGHRSTQSTSHYLKINFAALKQCPLDPDAVFSYEN